MSPKNFEEWLRRYGTEFHPVVPLNKGDQLLLMDFTDQNTELTDEVLKNTNLFINYINTKLQSAGAKYGVGGYGEHRTIYSHSKLFDDAPSNSAPPKAEGSNAQPSLSEDTDKTIGKFYQEADPLNYLLLKEFVAKHRSRPTRAEDFLWQQLRGKKLQGYKFRRQHIIGNFIADFVCLSKKVIIEVDGLVHQLPENKESDEARTLWLKNKKYEVIRVTNEEVLFYTEQTLNNILQVLEHANPPPKKVFIKNKTSYVSEQGSADSSHVGGSWMGAEPRRFHLGIDIWGKPYTKVMAPLNGIVHSFAFNNAFGDYGTTIILTHNLDGITFHSLYGHLSLASIKNLHEGDVVRKGDVFAEFGIPFENGQWPPHLHFQLIIDMQGRKGDYPGVCRFSERETYLANCPDPDIILGMMKELKSTTDR